MCSTNLRAPAKMLSRTPLPSSQRRGSVMYSGYAVNLKAVTAGHSLKTALPVAHEISQPSVSAH